MVYLTAKYLYILKLYWYDNMNISKFGLLTIEYVYFCSICLFMVYLLVM